MIKVEIGDSGIGAVWEGDNRRVTMFKVSCDQLLREGKQ